MNKKLLFLCIIGSLAFAQCLPHDYTKGQKLYDIHCSNCHMNDGSGLKRVYPPIKSEFSLEHFDLIPCIIKNGYSDTINIGDIRYNSEMPAFPQLSPFEITNLMNFMNNEFEFNQAFQTLQNIRLNLENCE